MIGPEDVIMIGFQPEHALVFGVLLAIVGGGWIMLVLRLNPRLFLRNYPAAIRHAAPPATPGERRAGVALGVPLFALLIGIPFWSGFDLANGHPIAPGALFLDAFVVGMVANLVDLLIIDLLWLGLFPPRWAMIPGTEEVPYKPEYLKHLRGFAVGSVVAAIIAFVVSLVIPH